MALGSSGYFFDQCKTRKFLNNFIKLNTQIITFSNTCTAGMGMAAPAGFTGHSAPSQILQNLDLLLLGIKGEAKLREGIET